MCPEATRRESCFGGSPWLALPSGGWRDDDGGDGGGGSLAKRRSSGFGERSACNACKTDLFIHYDCEPHTDWVHLDAVPNFDTSTVPTYHIHAGDKAGGDFGDHNPIFAAFDAWVPDPCRPAGEPEPKVCYSCYQVEGVCTCEGGPVARADFKLSGMKYD